MLIRLNISAKLALFILSTIITSTLQAESKIGVILPMSGDFARYGERLREGLESERSPSVEYVYEDEGCSPRNAVNAFHKLHSFDKAKLFLGPWCGSPQVAVAALLPKVGGLAILGGSAPERVYQLSSGRMFAVQPSIESESRFNAQEAYRLGARKVVIVFDENDFSRAHEDAFRKTFKGEVLKTLAYSSPDGSSLREIATRIKQLAPDTVYIPDASPLMHGLIKLLGTLGMNSLRLMSVYSAQSDDVLKVLGNGGEGLIYSYPDIPGDAIHHYSRLAAQVLGYGLQACPSQDVDCIKEELIKKYSFDEHGAIPGKLRLKTIRDGRFDWY